VAYVAGNPRTKKELKSRVAKGDHPSIMPAGMFPPAQNGVEHVEGPHYPEPHAWYAKVEVQDGKIIRVIS
jgi:hypothetical protein